MEPLTVNLNEEMIKERIFEKNFQIMDLEKSIEALKIVYTEIQRELRELNAWRETLRDE